MYFIMSFKSLSGICPTKYRVYMCLFKLCMQVWLIQSVESRAQFTSLCDSHSNYSEQLLLKKNIPFFFFYSLLRDIMWLNWFGDIDDDCFLGCDLDLSVYPGKYCWCFLLLCFHVLVCGKGFIILTFIKLSRTDGCKVL